MNERKRKILAYIGLGFMAVFSVSIVMFFIDFAMFGGWVAFITMFSGVGGIGILFYIKQQDAKADKPYLPKDIDGDDVLDADGAEVDGEQERVAIGAEDGDTADAEGSSVDGSGQDKE